LPSRLCAVALPFFAPLCGMGARGVKRGLKATRDAHSAMAYGGRPSLNDAMPAAAFAGALGIKLGGVGHPPADDSAIDGELKEPGAAEIKKAALMMASASVFMLLACCLILIYFI
jgi:cobalamin biosynthesis protein CobD/CbiB